MEECQTSAIHSLPLRVWAGVLKSPLIDSLIMKVSLRTLYDMVNGTTWLLSYLLRLLDVSVPRLAGFSLITRSPYLLYLRYHLSGERGPDNALPSASRLEALARSSSALAAWKRHAYAACLRAVLAAAGARTQRPHAEPRLQRT